MILTTERLVLRPWKETDAESLYEYAKDPDIGPSAGWPVHENIAESREVIKNVFQGKECYAVCEKETDRAIGAIELKLNGSTDMTEQDNECELGYWLGKPFWGRGYIPEAAEELICHGFEDLGMTTIWCRYYDGNEKSKRVQEKLGFLYHHTCDEVPVPLLNEVRVEHTNYMTGNQWKMRHERREKIKMFRPIRRKKRMISEKDAKKLLLHEKRAVLAVNGDDGYPFAFPINYFYEPESGKIYFHGAKSGHKIDAIKNNPKVSISIIDQEDVIEEELTTYFRSIILFGKAKILQDDDEIYQAVNALGLKYCDDEIAVEKEIQREWKVLCCVEIIIEHLTGKQAIELVK